MRSLFCRLSLAFALCVSASAAAAAPVLSGLYRVGDLGLVDFKLQDGRVVGTYKGQGRCPFVPERTVVKGVFDGSFFVGTVQLCQEGPGCDADKAFWFLGLSKDTIVSGQVKLDSGCSSPALDEKRLVITEASVEQKQAVYGDSQGASAIARSKANARTAGEQARDALNEADNHFFHEDYALAEQGYLRVLSFQNDNWAVMSRLGASQIHEKKSATAVETLSRAVQLMEKDRQVSPDAAFELYFNLACAQTQAGQRHEAIGLLRQALNVSPTRDNLLAVETDADLKALGGEQEFRRLIAEVRVQVEKKRKPK
jgi:Flp pilus assembly protein TadD